MFEENRCQRAGEKAFIIDFPPTMKTEIFTFKLHLLIGICMLLKRGRVYSKIQEHRIFDGVRMISSRKRGKTNQQSGKIFRSFSIAEAFVEEAAPLLFRKFHNKLRNLYD